MPKVIGTGAITMVDTHDIAAISTQVVASAALQQLYDGVAYAPDRSASPLGLTVKVYKAASGSPILIPPESLTNIRWGSSAGASDLNSGVSGVTAVLNQLTISTNSFVSAYEGGRTVYFSAEYVDPYAGVTQAINTSITLLLSVKGADGAVGGSVDVTSNRSLVFAYRDGISETPTDIVLTAVTSSIPEATFKWLLDGVEQAEVGHTFIMSLERFGVLSKSRQVTAVVQGGTNLYQSSVTILRTDTYSVEAGATKGATLGQDFVDDNGTVLSDLALLNKYSNGTQLAGDFTGNPFLVRVDGTYDRPANVKSVWGSSLVSQIAFASSARDSLLLSGDTILRGAGWPAFRTQYGMKYRIVLRWRLSDFASGGAGVSFTTLCKNSEIAAGCTHLGMGAAEAGVDTTSTYNTVSQTKVIADTSGIAAGASFDKQALTGASPSAWQSTTLEFTPDASVLWASFVARLSDAVGAQAKLEIDTCYIYSITGIIYADQIAAGAVTSDKILAGAITADKLTIGTTKFDNLRIKSYGNNMVDKTQGVWLNNVSQGSGSRGTTLWVFDKTTHAFVSKTTYDTYAAVADCDALATALAALTSTSLVLITTADAVSFNSTNDALRTQLKRCGASILVDGFTAVTQYAYALIGYPTLGEGNGLEMGKSTGASETPCELSTLWMDGTVVGLSGSISTLAPLSSTYIKDGSILTAKIAAGAVTANEIATNTITAAKIAAGTITGDKISAGTITGDKISAGTINAGHLAVGDFANLVVDANGDSGVSPFGSSYVVDVGNGTHAYRCTEGVRDSWGNLMPVQSGDQYYFSADVSWVSGAQSRCGIGMSFVDGSGNFVNHTLAASTTTYDSSTWTRITGVLTVPSGYYRGCIWWQRDGFGIEGCGVWNMRNLQIRKRIDGGDLIVAGTITADKIAAGTITGDKIAANQTLSAPVINGGTGTFTGTVTANAGTFNNVTIKNTCTFEGTINGSQVLNGVLGAIVRGGTAPSSNGSTVGLSGLSMQSQPFAYTVGLMFCKAYWTSGAANGRFYATIVNPLTQSTVWSGNLDLGNDTTNVASREFIGWINVPANTPLDFTIKAHNVSGSSQTAKYNLSAIAYRGTNNVIF